MEKSQVKNLIIALNKAKGDFKPIEKNKSVRTNAGKLMYSYATLDQIIEKTQPALSSNGLCLVQLLNGEDGKLTIETILFHESGESIQSKVTVAGHPKPQEAGSIITYYKRYSYSAILGISSDEDTDGSAVSGQKQPVQGVKSAKPSEKQRATLNELFKRINYTPGEKAISKLKNMSAQQMNEVIQYVSGNEEVPEFLEK